MNNTVAIPAIGKVVIGLGITCTIGYGTIFYSFSLMSVQIEQAFGWSKAFIFGVFSIGLFAGGMLAPWIGRYLDRVGTRTPMTLGSLLVALGLAGLSQVDSRFGFALAIIFVESLAVLVLYETAFVALTQLAGRQARVPITQITLIAGFASTLFWPFIAWMLEWLDWRQTYLVLASLHLLICMPIHWRIMRPQPPSRGDATLKASSSYKKIIYSPAQHRVQWLLAFALGVGAFAIAAIQIHLFGLLAGLGVSTQQAVIIGVLIGPAQVAARVMELVLGKYVNPVVTGVFSLAMMTVGILCLFFTPNASVLLPVFAIFFGIGQGLTYIVRGVIPLHLFGEIGYGALTGRLNGVRMILTAAAPLSFALLIEQGGSLSALSVLTALLAMSVIALWWCRQ